MAVFICILNEALEYTYFAIWSKTDLLDTELFSTTSYHLSNCQHCTLQGEQDEAYCHRVSIMAGQIGCGGSGSEQTSQRGVEFRIADASTNSVWSSSLVKQR